MGHSEYLQFGVGLPHEREAPRFEPVEHVRYLFSEQLIELVCHPVSQVDRLSQHNNVALMQQPTVVQLLRLRWNKND